VGRIAGKVAVITGAGTGIGRAIAIRFAAEGARVVLAGRRTAPLEAVATATGGLAVATDVADEASVEKLFKTCVAHFGAPDILVNNAGITGPVASAADMDLRNWDECMAINVRGVILCLKHGIRAMQEAGKKGSVINMSSLMGLRGYPMRSAYSATKFAVIGITQAVAHEVGPLGIRVNALCPGAVSGELMDRVIAARARAENRPPEDIIKKNYTDAAALRKWVEPEEVAAAALFLACDESSATTGESIKVDAGRM
jgi:NAD(P)-dependent dehydrogenase (short-subunit alcohol dehydrogenase family)